MVDRRCHGPKVLFYTPYHQYTRAPFRHIWAMNLFVFQRAKKNTYRQKKNRHSRRMRTMRTNRTREKKMCNQTEETCGRFLFRFNALNMTNVTARYSYLAFTFYNKSNTLFRLLSSTIDPYGIHAISLIVRVRFVEEKKNRVEKIKLGI